MAVDRLIDVPRNDITAAGQYVLARGGYGQLTPEERETLYRLQDDPTEWLRLIPHLDVGRPKR